MTKGEAIDMCMEVRDYLTSGNPIWNKDKVREALDMAIEALEETPRHSRPRPIDPTIEVDLESGVVPISACDPKGPKTIVYVDRREGKWIEINNGADTTCECSECHHRDYIPNVKTEQNKYECMDRYWFERNFCPNCGADMRGEENE